MTTENERDVVREALERLMRAAYEVSRLHVTKEAEWQSLGGALILADGALRSTALAASAAQPSTSGGEALREAWFPDIWAALGDIDGLPHVPDEPEVGYVPFGSWRKRTYDLIVGKLATSPAETGSGATPVTLAQCPIGLFKHPRGGLCLKTEYGNNEGRIDAYIVSTGEFFWGDPPQTIASQRAQMVTPVRHPDTTPAASGQAVAQEHRFYAPDANTKDAPLGSVVSFVHGPDPLNVFAMLKVRGHEQSKMIDAWAAYPREMQAYAKRCLKRATHPAPSAASVRAELLTDLMTVRHEVFGTAAGDCPDPFADFDRAVELKGMLSRVIEELRALQTPQASREGRADG